MHITIVYEVKNTRNNFTWFGKLLDSLEADENTGTSDLKAIFLHSQYPLVPYHYRQTSLVQSICPRFQLYSSQVPTSSSSSGPILFGSYPNTHTHTHTHTHTKNLVDIIFTRHCNPFIQNVEKWPDIHQKSWGVYTARFLKYVSPFFNIMHKRVEMHQKMFFWKSAEISTAL